MFFDYTYLIIVLPAILLALWAQANVSGTFKKYQKVRSASNLTGFEAARMILDGNGLYDVKIERVAGNLTDHYDPRSNLIRLSEPVYDNPSPAAIGVAAHEAGHAVQYATGYGPIKLRAAILPVCSIGSNLAMPLVLLGLILNMFNLCYIGIGLFGLATLFQLVTLPVEFNASSRALAALRASNLMPEDDLAASKKVLTAAALTYVAALAVSLANLLRLVILVGGRGRRD